MKKFFEGACLVLGVLVMFFSLYIMFFVEKPEKFTIAVIMLLFVIMFLVLSASLTVEIQAAKTRRLLRKIHGIEKEEGEED